MDEVVAVSARKDSKRRQGRKAYTQPVLRDFGPVGRLTQGGTAGDIEPMTMMGMMNTMRRP